MGRVKGNAMLHLLLRSIIAMTTPDLVQQSDALGRDADMPAIVAEQDADWVGVLECGCPKGAHSKHVHHHGCILPPVPRMPCGCAKGVHPRGDHDELRFPWRDHARDGFGRPRRPTFPEVLAPRFIGDGPEVGFQPPRR